MADKMYLAGALDAREWIRNDSPTQAELVDELRKLDQVIPVFEETAPEIYLYLKGWRSEIHRALAQDT